MKSSENHKPKQKKRHSKYDEVFKVNATFDEILHAAIHTNKRDLKSYKEIQKLKNID